MNRLYLKEAKRDLEELGGVYRPSRIENKGLKFNRIINDLNSIRLDTGSFFEGYIASEIEMSKTDLVITIADFEGRLLNHFSVNKVGFLYR